MLANALKCGAPEAVPDELRDAEKTVTVLMHKYYDMNGRSNVPDYTNVADYDACITAKYQ
jgi:hypothetical protein